MNQEQLQALEDAYLQKLNASLKTLKAVGDWDWPAYGVTSVSAVVVGCRVRNATANPDCVVTIENALDPVVVEGTAEVISDIDAIARFLDCSNAKYETAYSLDFLDPAVNATIRVQPHRAFGLLQEDFTGSPTRWLFDSA